MNRFQNLVARHPVWVVVAVLAVSVLAGARMYDFHERHWLLEVDPAFNTVLPDEDEEKQFYEHVRRLFGSDETMLVAVVDEDVFTYESLDRLARLTRSIEQLDGVHHVISIVNALTVRSRDGDIEIEPFANPPPESPEALQALREEALSNPIFAGTLVSTDARSAALLVYFLEMPEREFTERGIDQAVREVATAEGGDARILFAGPPYVKAEITRLLIDDLRSLLPLTFSILAVVALLSFRTLAGVVVPLASILIAVLWTLSLMVALGRPLNLVTNIVPPLVLTVGFAYAVHVVAAYYRIAAEFGEGADAEGLTRRTLRELWLPVFLTGVTTAIGLLALLVSPMGAIREFGVLSVVGIVFALIVCLSFTPAMMCLSGVPRRGAGGSSGRRFDRLAEWLARFDLRHRRAILVLGLAVFVVSLYGMTRIQVGTDLVSNLKPDHPVVVDFNAVNEQLGGANPFYVVIETEYPNAFKEPENLALIHELQVWLEAHPLIGDTTSVADYVMLLNRGFHDNDPAYLALPETRRQTSQILFFGASDELERFVDSRYQTASIVVRSQVIDSGAVAALAAEIDEHLAQLPPYLHGRVTGNSVVFANMADDISRGQAQSLLAAVIAIYAVLAILFTSLRIGAVALLPNILPVAVYFGILGFSGVSLNLVTGLVACIVLGIAVDDTIHYLTQFNVEAKARADEEAGTIAALRAVGRPITYTTVALALGFLSLTQTSLRYEVEFGSLAAITLCVAWLLDVTLTPALGAGMRIVTLWDVLSLDLGRDPQKSIPMFHGLRRAQARIVALMASIRKFGAGEAVMRIGETGDCMYVVIDGELAISVPGEDGKRVDLGTISRGDVVGEVALFVGQRTADVDAVTDVELLRLTERSLERLRRRYPRIAAQVQRNLSLILAKRLASTTQRLG